MSTTIVPEVSYAQTGQDRHTPSRDLFQLAADLREAAKLIDELAEAGVECPYLSSSVHINPGFMQTDKAIEQCDLLIDLLNPVRKSLTAYSLELVRSFPVLSVRWRLQRDQLCKKVRVKKTVEELVCAGALAAIGDAP